MKLIQYDEPSLKDNKKFDLLGNIKISGVDVSVVKGKRVDEMHRWAFPVICYPRNMLIYHYLLIGVIFLVILLICIIQNYPNFFSKYYPKFTIRVIYPFIFNLGDF